MLKSILRQRRGQGMTEYIIIVVVVAVLSLAIVIKFGDKIRTLFVGTSQAMAGKNDEAKANIEKDTMQGVNPEKKSMADL